MIDLETRNRILDQIVPWDGMGCATTLPLDVRKSTGSLLFPNDDLDVVLSSAGTMSNCLLLDMAAMRFAGVVHPLLQHPYFGRRGGQPCVVGDAPAWVQKIAKDLGAWRDPAVHDCILHPADMVLIGGRFGEELHGFTVISFTALDGKMPSIDGGQGLYGAMISRRERRLGFERSTGLYRTWEGPNLDQPGRHVLGWIDLGAMLP